MLGPTHTYKTFKAQRIFTDREIPLKKFIKAVNEKQSNKDYRILSFHGVGGQGKTALCEQFCITLANEKTCNTHLGWAKLNFDILEQRSIIRALLNIRLQLIALCNIPFPAFESAFARYFAFAHQGQDIRTEYPELFKQPSSALQDIETFVGDFIAGAPGLGFFYKYSQKISTATKKWWQRCGKEVLKELDMIDQYKLLDALPTYLGADLYDWLYVNNFERDIINRRLVIILDAYEALWRDQSTKTGLEAMHVDAWVRKLVEESPGVLFVLLGRDKLDWAELDNVWEPVIDSRPLDGLLSGDADKFLQQVPITEADVRTAIIQAAEGLPFYLDLQVTLYEVLKQQNIQPSSSDFGGKQQDILPRFMDHLDESNRRALQIVAHARFMDEPLVRQLSEEFLGGIASIDFKRLTYYSFWKQEGKIWRLHALMRGYLQDRQRKDEPELYNTIHQYLFEIYDNKLSSLKQVNDITETHKLALIEAGYHLQQYDTQRFPAWANKRGQIFNDAYAWEQLVPLWERALEVAEFLLGKIHLDTATTLNNLAALCQSQGNNKEAERQYLRAIVILEKVFPDGHPNLDRCKSNYAALKSKHSD